jgi:S-DNA-T family DNA segregation ATPase FtsK/SpoIIIE
VLLLVDGVEAAGALLDEADPGRGTEGLLRLVRDGAAVGVTCVLTADRALPGGRLAAAARMRLLLPFPDRADYAVTGVPARAVPTHRPPGRALLGEDPVECQLALPRTPAPRLSDPSGAAATSRPVRIVDLPGDPVLPADPQVADDVPARRWRVTVGPGGDDGSLLDLDLDRTGGLLVVGPPRSGRTTALESFARRLAASGAEVAHVSPAYAASASGLPGCRLDAADPGAVLAWSESLRGRRGVLVADDLGPVAEYPALAALPRTGAGTGIVLFAAGSAGQLTGHYQGPVAALRRARTGLLLCPGPAEAEALGIRLPRLPLPQRPGSGWLVADGAAQRVQVARTLPGPAPGR